MRIIKDGNPQTRQINCPVCSCVFLADICDYQLLVNDQGLRVRCPYCNYYMDVDFKDAPLCDSENQEATI